MSMARASSGLAYPERFYAAASYAGFDGSVEEVTSKFSSDLAVLLYALYQQIPPPDFHFHLFCISQSIQCLLHANLSVSATVGPCNIQKPSSWSPVEQSKWKSWQGLGNMATTEAMRLFVKILEEEDPGWYSRASNFATEPIVDVQMNDNSKTEPVMENGNSSPETKNISTENGSLMETQDKDVVSEGLSSVVVYDQWIAPPISGQHPKARYEELA